VVVAGVQVVRTSLADSLAGSRRAPIVASGVAIAAPAGWRVEGNQVRQPDDLVRVTFERQVRGDPTQQLAMWIAKEGRALTDELGALTSTSQRVIALPAGWEGAELEASQEDGTGYRQRIRVVMCGRAFGSAVILIWVAVPESIARAAPEAFVQLLASIGPA